MTVTIDIDELKAAAEVIFDGCLQLLSLIDGKENARLRFLDELKKNGNGKIIAFPSANKGVQTNTNFEKEVSKWGVLKLTNKEILKLPKQYREPFRKGKTFAHIRLKENGVYEIRCQINNIKISTSSKNLETAKAKFLKKLVAAVEPPKATVEPVAPVAAAAPPVTLAEYMLKWLETVKKPTVKEISYNQYLHHYKTDICPILGGKPLAEIKPFDLQKYVNDLVAAGKHRTAKQTVALLKMVFDYAVIDDIILKSPMLKVKVPHFEPETGIPLTREEEKTLVGALVDGGNIYVQAYVFMLYTGLRRSELASVQIADGFVSLISAKRRKGYKDKLRSVPICPMLAPLLPLIDIEGIKSLKSDNLSLKIKDILPNHHTHELRHTFITRAQECGCRREIVSLWAGHTADSSITSAVYTHLETNKELQIIEMAKFNYTL